MQETIDKLIACRDEIKRLHDEKDNLVKELRSKGMTWKEMATISKMDAIVMYHHENECTLREAKDSVESFLIVHFATK